MATIEQLEADQRAIIELVLQRGRSYDELSEMLGTPPARVRELARAALAELAPATAARVDPQWRGQLADYVLGQQSGPESTATRDHLERSEPARAWAMSLLDSLDGLYGNGVRPEVPEARAAPPDTVPAPLSLSQPRRRGSALRGALGRLRPGGDGRREREGTAALSPAARAIVRRRRIVGGVVAAVVVAGAVAVGVTQLGGEEPRPAASGGGQNAAANQGTRVLRQVVLRPLRGERGEGAAVLAQRGGTQQLLVQATNVERTGRREAYEVWLYNSRTDAKSVGAQVPDREGNLQGAGPLPKDWQRYRFIDVSREGLDRRIAHSGRSIMRGAL